MFACCCGLALASLDSCVASLTTSEAKSLLHTRRHTQSNTCNAHKHPHTDDDKELARVGPGQCFGELALLNSEGRAANVMALEDAQARVFVPASV